MRIQTPFEEKLNALTHGIGVVFGVLGFMLLIRFNTHRTDWSLFSVVVYGLSFVTLFIASTCYHLTTDDKRKHYFRVLDHISIYLLIAGTYTPVCLITLEGSLGWTLFFTVWGIAIFGVFLKLFFTGKFEIFSVVLYLAMGWLVVFDFSYLSHHMNENGLMLLFAGGLAYTAGIIFYTFEKIPYNHVIWHLFVLAGALCHFFMVLDFVI